MKEKLEALVSEMIDRGLRYEEAVGEFERKFILSALEKNKGNQTKAAKAVGIHRNTLNKRLASYNHHKRSKHYLTGKI
ncbi:MAG: hypothetical protein EXQ58_04285 [Acidobacteria bacterium]|nr:hypothetical protein [Acidobacteriota bacterium]